MSSDKQSQYNLWHLFSTPEAEKKMSTFLRGGLWCAELNSIVAFEGDVEGSQPYGIFALDLVKNGKVRVWAYSAGFLDTAYEARDEDQAEEIDAPSEPLKSIDRPGPRKDARNALRNSGA